MSKFSIHILSIRDCPLCAQRSAQKPIQLPFVLVREVIYFLNNLNLMLRETNSRGLFNSVSQNQLNPMRNFVLDFKNIKLH